MRRPQHLISAPSTQAQSGFALFIVLIMMIVIAFLVVAATQTYNTELRISSNDADRKIAMQLAEAALRAGEERVAGDYVAVNDPTSYSDNCTDGLCTTAEEGSDKVAAWLRACPTGATTTCLEMNGRVYNTDSQGKQINNQVAKKPRYIIEFVDSSGQENIFRVTARAWGSNENTMVTVQSYVSSGGQ